jgi:hypothetical protein
VRFPFNHSFQHAASGACKQHCQCIGRWGISPGRPQPLHESGDPLVLSRSRHWAQNPMVGSLPDCCARAASGHAPAAPPPSRMTKSRRRIPDTRAPPRNRSAAPFSLPPTPWQVLGADLNCSESRRRAACPSMMPAQAPNFAYSCQASTEHFEQWAEIARSALNRSDHLTALVPA